MELDKMGKTELRAECKKAGVKSYSKLTVAMMRAALTALRPTAPLETAFTDPSGRDNQLLSEVFPMPGAPAAPVVKDKKKPAPKVEREERNGIKRPVKGKCADVWNALDELRAKGEENLTTAIHAVGEKRGWNKNNVGCELSAYRRFHGIARSKGV